jgi:mono/diheme cytochrome c family protein
VNALLVLACVGQSCIAQQTYAAPVQCQQTYAQPYAQNAYVEKTIFVAVEDAASYYTGLVGTAQRAAERQQQAQQATSSTDAKIDRLTALVEQLQRRIDASEPPIPSKPAAQPALPALVPSQSEAVPPPPTISQAASLRTIDTAGKGTHPGITVLAANCAECHGKNGTRKGGRQFFDRSGQTLEADAVALSAMRDAILAGTMPPQDRKPLTLREFASINELVNQQASGLAVNTTNQRKKIK